MSVSSNIKLYYNSKLIPSKNYMLDDFTTYLSSLNHLDLNNFQYQKIEIDMKIKINMDQSNLIDIHYNYASINHDDMTYYYFITDFKWIAHNTIELTLSMDTINTFRYQINSHFTNKTKITRQHKDRFVYDARAGANAIYLSRAIDKEGEGTGSLTKLGYTYEITPDNTQLKTMKWYLIYKNNTDDDNSPVRCYLCANKPLKINTSVTRSLPTGNVRFIDPEVSNTSITIAGTTYTNQAIAFQKDSSGTSANRVAYFIYNRNDYGDYVQQGSAATVDVSEFIANDSFWYKTTASTNFQSTYTRTNLESWTDEVFIPQGVIPSIGSVDRTDSKLIKIIELPYPPTELTYSNDVWSWSGSDLVYDYTIGLLRLSNLNTEFKAIIKDNYDIPNANVLLPVVSNRKSLLKDSEYESKLYHSDYYNWKFAYDSFSKTFALERLDLQNTQYDTFPGVKITFSPANTITSNLGFKFDFLNSTYRQIEDFEPYLIANRNNESPVYNSSYLNYLRTGYNYDIKNKERQDTFNWFGTGLQIAGAAASFAIGSAVPGAQVSYAAGISLATSAIASIASNINSAISAEQNINQKLSEAKAQAISISASDDLSLLHFYNGQCLRYGYYTVTDKMKDVLFDLFHYCGYADGRQSIPNTDSRRCFNYIQCEPVFDNEQDTIWLKYIDDVKTRFKAGVTVMHKFNNGSTTDYDFDQKYENFETWICNRS